jgi:hypothetical protein
MLDRTPTARYWRRRSDRSRCEAVDRDQLEQHARRSCRPSAPEMRAQLAQQRCRRRKAPEGSSSPEGSALVAVSRWRWLLQAFPGFAVAARVDPLPGVSRGALARLAERLAHTLAVQALCSRRDRSRLRFEARGPGRDMPQLPAVRAGKSQSGRPDYDPFLTVRRGGTRGAYPAVHGRRLHSRSLAHPPPPSGRCGRGGRRACRAPGIRRAGAGLEVALKPALRRAIARQTSSGGCAMSMLSLNCGTAPPFLPR